MSTSKNHDALVYAGGLLLQQGVTFFSAILVARWLGAGDYGILSLVRNVFTVALILAPLGLDLSLLKHLAQFGVEQTQRGSAHVTRLRLWVGCFNCTIVTGIYFVIGPYFEHYVYNYPHFALYLTLAFLSLPIAADCALLTAVFRSRGKAMAQSLVALYVQPLVRISALAIALWTGLGLAGVLVAIVIGYACADVILSVIYWLWTCKEPKYKMQKLDQSDLMALMRMSFWMAMGMLVYSVLRNMDILILGKLSTSVIVGQYSALSTLAQLTQIFPQAFSQTLGPTVARLYLAGEIYEMRAELLRYLRSASLLAAPMAACLAMYSPWFDMIMGSTFQFSTAVSSTLAAGYFISAVMAPMGYSLSMTGHHLQELVILVVGTLITALMCWYGGSNYGANGVAMAILLGFVLINLARGILVYFTHRFILFDRRILQPVIISVVIAISCRITADQYLPYSLFPRLLAVIGTCLLIFGAFWLFVFSLTERQTVLKKINRHNKNVDIKKLSYKQIAIAEIERERQLDNLGDALQIINKHIDIQSLSYSIDQIIVKDHKIQDIQKTDFSTETGVRLMILQDIYNLNDEQLQYQLLDRLSFQRFVKLRNSNKLPNSTEIMAFRKKMLTYNISNRIIDCVNQELNKKGYILQNRQINDAKIIINANPIDDNFSQKNNM